MPKKIPIGIQDFRKLIEYDFKYIDKTRYVHQMTSYPGAYFLSRPRRFGKSITVALLDELYSGSKELFKGLWIEDHWNWEEQYPVIKLSLTAISYQSIGLESAIAQELQTIADRYNVKLTKTGIAPQFKQLITALAKTKKVVVLIDEYDAPIIHFLGKDIDQAIANRERLKEFYTVLKEADSYIEFVFITGVSKFSEMEIFSGLNNLQDISMHPGFATMLGYTQEELEHYFPEELEATAAHMKISKRELLEKLRNWYNGYRFEENAETVYNPVSVNTFFSFKKCQNFWFATGTPTFLINLLKDQGIFDLNFEHLNPSGFDSFELQQLKPAAILYQTGYLTIKDQDQEGFLTLDYPNKEVRDAMIEHLIEGFVGVDVEFSAALIIKIRKAFFANDLESVMRILTTVFKGLPCFLHEKFPERFFHAAIHLLFTYLGLRVQSEVCTSDGRVDSVVETDTHIYIFEFKLDEPAQTALDQIHQKKYYQAYWQKDKPVVGIGVNFSSQTKNIDDWQSEAMSTVKS